MTMVPSLRSPAPGRMRVAGMVWMATVLAAALAVADEPPVHFLHAGAMPPGAIGGLQLQRGGPLPGYFQPVEIMAPEGAMVSLADGADFMRPAPGPLGAGMLIGAVYRLKVTNIPNHEGLEVYPTIEVIDRLYPPIGQETRFPIPIQITQEEIEMALSGRFVTRVIYLEDPQNPLPVAEQPDEQTCFEIVAGRQSARRGRSLGSADGHSPTWAHGCPMPRDRTPRFCTTRPPGSISAGGHRAAGERRPVPAPVDGASGQSAGIRPSRKQVTRQVTAGSAITSTARLASRSTLVQSPSSQRPARRLEPTGLSAVRARLPWPAMLLTLTLCSCRSGTPVSDPGRLPSDPRGRPRRSRRCREHPPAVSQPAAWAKFARAAPASTR